MQMRYFSLLFIAAVSLLTTACGTLQAPSYSADFATVDSMKRQGLAKTSIGKALPDDVKAKVNSISLRGSTMAPVDTTFAGYVSNALASDLKDAGLLDATASRRIEVVLLNNIIDVSGFSQGVGQIEIELLISERTETLLRKKYATKTTFESGFAGATAIPKGQIEYPNLVRALWSSVYQDADFIKAMKPK
jgi:hypothetical protein